MLRAQHIVGVHLCEISEGVSFLSCKLIKSLIPPASPERLLFELSNQHKLWHLPSRSSTFSISQRQDTIYLSVIKSQECCLRLDRGFVKRRAKKIEALQVHITSKHWQEAETPTVSFSYRMLWVSNVQALLRLSQIQINILWLRKKIHILSNALFSAVTFLVKSKELVSHNNILDLRPHTIQRFKLTPLHSWNGFWERGEWVSLSSKGLQLLLAEVEHGLSPCFHHSSRRFGPNHYFASKWILGTLERVNANEPGHSEVNLSLRK